MFKFWGSQEPQTQPEPPPRPDGSSQSWYPPSVVNSSCPSTPGGSSSGSFSVHRLSEWPQSPSQALPGEAAGVISPLKDKSIDELRKLLSDKEAYQQFLLSLDQVKIQNNDCTLMLRCKQSL